MAIKIIACGGYLPNNIITNNDLAQNLDTSDEWITQRTGIKQRHVAQDESNLDMAIAASKEALKTAPINPSDIDLIITCTTTPDETLPSLSCRLQHSLGLSNIPAFDLQAVCSGFLYGLDVAKNMLLSSKYQNILLVCSEKMSSIVDWQDRSTCVLFGDGAGAMILQRNSEADDKGLIDSEIFSSGANADLLYTNGGIASTQHAGHIKMDGSKIFKLAIEKMTESCLSILQKNHIALEEVKYVIPHQANIRIMTNIAKRLGLTEKMIVSTVQEHANCSAASIPLALNTKWQQNAFQDGDVVIFTSFGAGLTWGAAIYRF